MASVALPPRCGPCLVIRAAGSQAAMTISATAASRSEPNGRLMDLETDPDVGDRDHEEAGHQHPGRQVDLALETAPRSIAAAEAAVAAADGAAEPGRLGRLEEDADHHQHPDHHVEDDERAL